jgi:glycosyltransferase involved in cell wall biosynthesis
MRILFLSRWYPYPPDNGSKLRIFNLLKHLSTQHDIDLLSFTSETLSDAQRDAMRAICRQVETVSYHPFHPTSAKALAAFFSPLPRSVIDTHNLAMQACVERTISEHEYEVVIASQIDMAPYALSVTRAPKILEELQIAELYEQFALESQPLKKIRRGLMWWKMTRYVRRLLRAFDACTVVSEPERNHALRIARTRGVYVVPNGVDMSYYAGAYGAPQPDTLIYAGALTYNANFDAVDFFARDILPSVQAQHPNVQLRVTGKADSALIERLPHNRSLLFTGYVSDVRPLIAQSWLSIAPLRMGGGTRLKILEALALGTPVVATSKGAEGLELVAGRDLLLADTPANFAEAVLNLLHDAELRATLSHNGQQAVKRYDWQRIGQDFCNWVEDISLQRAHSV